MPMTNKLQQYFPMIRTKEQLMAEIEEKPKLKSIFYSWKEEARQDFINFCTGARGVKMMYDFISKEILNPETFPLNNPAIRLPENETYLSVSLSFHSSHPHSSR